MSVSITPFGFTSRGIQVNRCTLSNSANTRVSVLDYGCTIQSLVFRDVDVALGYDTVTEYESGSGYLGAVIGRHANRIGNGVFTLNGNTYTLARNDGSNHLHGGNQGFDRHIWAVSSKENRLLFSRTSPDGEEGYPGNLEVCVEYELREDDTLVITYRACSDMDTVLNLTSHCYFNLNGHDQGSILNHTLWLDADSYTENDAECLPTGTISQVRGTPFDFREKEMIGSRIHCGHTQLNHCGGYDHNFVLNGIGPRAVGALTGDISGISMEVRTDQPGIQLYTGNFLTPRNGKAGTAYGKHSGICLETQHFPNAMAHPHFPSVVLKKGATFSSVTEYHFSL